jgi:hypothetical protein
MKRALFGFGLLILLSAGSIFAEGMESLLQAPLDALYGKQNAKPLVVCFNAFTCADQGLASAFSRYLESNLTLALKQCPQFELFARDKLEKILETQQLALSDLVSEKDTVRIGQLKSIQAMLSGRFFDTGANVEVFFDLTSVETGAVMTAARTVIPKSLIPGAIALLPDNYSQAVNMKKDLEKVEPGEKASFAIKAWTQRGNGGVFLDGEELSIRFLANANCFIKIYHIDVNGDMELIFPNQYQSDNRIVKNKVYIVPDVSSEFVFKLGKPYGTEFIKVIGSTEQFQTIETSLDSLGQGSKALITRGLSVKQRQARLAETMLSYTILEPK